MVSAEIFDDLMVVQCGRLIKYVRLSECNEFNSKNTSEEVEDSKHFKEAKINFNKNFEIVRLRSICKENEIQIIAKDNIENIIIIVTWNFDKNIETSMFQFKCESNQSPEHYIVKGINEKMNYFISENQIFDLEYNIPFQQSTSNSMKAQISQKKRTLLSDSTDRFDDDKIENSFENFKKNMMLQQRKIYRDDTRYLGVDEPNILFFPITRMDIIFWKNIKELGASAQIIAQNTKL